jgi:hypothetical protein
MPRTTWPLLQTRPRVEIVLTLAIGGQPTRRVLLADTGAGSEWSAFELVLEESDCLICGGGPTTFAHLKGAYSGSYPIYGVRVQIPQICFDNNVEVVGVNKAPSGFDGIACFRFLNRFTYGNFGARDQFGIET